MRLPFATAGQFTTVGDAASVSVYFLAGTDQASQSNSYVGFGINTTNDNPVASAGIVAGITTAAGTGTDPSALNHTLLLTSRNNVPGTTNSNDTSTFTLSTDNWYEIKLDLSYTGSNNFSATTELYNWGTDGVTGGTLVDSYTATRSLSSIVGTDLYGGFQARSTGGGGLRPQAADNFSLTSVPEPTSIALLTLGGMCLLRRRRAV